ncbi:MAG TPA: ABC transporter ATP-binding protein [Polyangiaceae bacterium]|jgi:ABC-type multidrug transport system fused ATPase/permease subunit
MVERSDWSGATLEGSRALAIAAAEAKRGILSAGSQVEPDYWLRETKHWYPRVLPIAALHYATLMALPATLLGLASRLAWLPLAAGVVLEVLRSLVRGKLKRRVRQSFLREVAIRALDKRTLTPDADVEAAFWAAYLFENAITVDAPALLAAALAGLSILALATPAIGARAVLSFLALLSVAAALTVWTNRRRSALIETVVRERQHTADWIAAAERDTGEIYGSRARAPFLTRLGNTVRQWSSIEEQLDNARLRHRMSLAGLFFAGVLLILRADHVDLAQLLSAERVVTRAVSGLLLLGSGVPVAYVFVVHADSLLGAHSAILQILQPRPSASVASHKLSRRPDRLEARGLSFKYASTSRPVFDGLDFDADLRRVLLVVAPNGGGKTTLARLVCGILAPDGGELLLDGVSCSELSRDEFGFVPQNPLIVESLSVEENVRLITPDVSNEAIDRVLLELGLDAPRGRRAGELSRGQQRRIAIARAILKQPRLLLLDEPDASLDAEGRHLLSILLRRQLEQRAVLVISHRADWLRDDVCLLDLSQLPPPFTAFGKSSACG